MEYGIKYHMRICEPVLGSHPNVVFKILSLNSKTVMSGCGD